MYELIQNNDVCPPWTAFLSAVLLAVLAFISRTTTSRKMNVMQDTDLRKQRLRNAHTFRVAAILGMINLVFLGGIQMNFKISFLTMALIGVIVVLAKMTFTFLEIPKDSRPLWLIFGNDENDNKDRRKIFASDKYQDFSTDLASSVFLGVTQVILIGMYCFGVWEAKQPDFSDPVIYSYYIVGIIMQIGYLQSKDNLQTLIDDQHFWSSAYKLAKSPKYAIEEFIEYSVKEGTKGKVYKRDLLVRFVFSSLINDIGFIAIFILLPLQLAGDRDSFSFVLNAVAAYFIVELDDTETEVSIDCIQEDNRTDSRDINDWHTTLSSTVSESASLSDLSEFGDYGSIQLICDV